MFQQLFRVLSRSIVIGSLLITPLTSLYAVSFRNVANTAHANTQITQEQAIEIARKDAIASNISLDIYEIKVLDEKKIWHVSFTRKDVMLEGGGFGILVSKKDGTIKKRIQYQ